MADYFQSQPNFQNPAYVSPEQLRATRAMSDALLRRSGQEVNRPTGAIANMIDALSSNLYRNNANNLEAQAAAGNAQDYADIIRQQQAGEKINPQTLGHLAANPMASPEARAWATKLISPDVGGDLRGNPTATTAAGGMQPLAVGNGVVPGVRTPTSVSPDGGIAGTTFTPAPQRGQPAPQSYTPGIGSADLGGAMDASNRLRMNAAGSGAAASFKKADLEAANAAPALKTIVGTMLDDLETHGKDWSMGPSAELSMKIKRLAANYAPGYMKDQLEKLASAESFDKMSAQLSAMTGNAGGSDAQLLNSIKSNPSLLNTFGGAQGLLRMRLQQLDQQMGLAMVTANANTPEEYLRLKNQFYANNPIRNPLTGNTIKQDFERQTGVAPTGGGGGARIIGVRPAQ